MRVQDTVKQEKRQHPLLTAKERLLIWQKARGIWKRKKPDPIQELKKIRDEWERKA